MATPYPDNAPPSGAPGGKTSLGLDSNLGAMLCYIANIICCLGVILSIIFLVTEKENRFVKFHALQSLLSMAVYVVLMIIVEILSVIMSIAHLYLIATAVSWGLWLILGLIFLLIWILAGIKAYGVQWYKVPIVGEFAWNIAN